MDFKDLIDLTDFFLWTTKLLSVAKKLIECYNKYRNFEPKDYVTTIYQTKGGEIMNKAELAQTLAEKINVPKSQAEDMLNSLLEVITTTLKSGGEVVLTGFGAFSVKTRAARVGVNPQKPTEKINIPAVKVPKFKAGKALKDELKK